jgi:pSer/pThr/pTyr-binding forkhead associated (FHA) protein
MWILRASHAAGSEELTFRIMPGGMKTLGRAVRADFVLDAPLVSRLHCRFTATVDGLEVEDLKSTNGTFVNDRRVKRHALAPGDRVRVGRMQLTVSRDPRD